MKLDLVTPRGTILEAEVDEMTAPGVLGEFGVLPGHVSFLTGIRAGVVRWQGPRGAGTAAVGKGFAEVANDRIVLLTEVGAAAKDIDVDAARRELAEAQSKLEHWTSEDAGARVEVEEQRDWAQARVDAAGAPPATAP